MPIEVAAAVATAKSVAVCVSMLFNAITSVMEKNEMFKRQLTQIQDTITKHKPSIVEIEKKTEVLGRGKQELDTLKDLLKGGEALVRKCGRVKWKIWKIRNYSKKLDNFNASFLRFCETDIQLLMFRVMLDLVAVEMKKNRGCGSSGFPLLKGEVIGFDDQARELKAMVLTDSGGVDCSVVVASGAQGCGKTTLVTMLCNDPEIEGKFGRNIYFVTISENPNLKIVMKNLLGKNKDFINEENAINQWGSFLREKREKSEKLLLVLDDVRSDSIIKQFKFKFHGYKILATSRIASKQFNTYKLRPLNSQDAARLFRLSAFSENGSKNHDIPDDLVDKLVKCCNNHPMDLNVIGDLLKGRRLISWVAMLNNLSDGQHSGLDSYDSISLNPGESSVVVNEFILDLGLYPDDQEVSAKMLMDKWVHLSKHDEEGSGTRTTHQFFRRCFKKPKNLSSIRRSTSSSSLIAGAAPLGAGLGLEEAVSRLSDAIINMNWNSSYFSKQFKLIQDIITRNKPFFDEIDTLIEALDQPEQEKDKFIAQLKSAQTFALKCRRVNLNLYKRYKYSNKVDKLTASLRRFCEVDAPWVVGRGILDLLVMRDLQKKI